MADPRVRRLDTDGRAHLLHTAERYDVVSLELGQVFRPGVAAFYTLEFYERARQRLRPDGLLVQFLPLPFLDAETLRSSVASRSEATVLLSTQLDHPVCRLEAVANKALISRRVLP